MARFLVSEKLLLGRHKSHVSLSPIILQSSWEASLSNGKILFAHSVLKNMQVTIVKNILLRFKERAVSNGS